jgi:hypothetical protein
MTFPAFSGWKPCFSADHIAISCRSLIGDRLLFQALRTVTITVIITIVTITTITPQYNSIFLPLQSRCKRERRMLCCSSQEGNLTIKVLLND